MNFETYVEDSLWPLLVETVHSLVMFPSHKAYTREVILLQEPDITHLELAVRLNISVGEAIVILYELSQDKIH
jgi:hypothetical protein